jgi:LPXTG-motif cell wall-anchored protein
MIRKMLMLLTAVAALLAFSTGAAGAQDNGYGPGPGDPGDEIDTVTAVRGETISVAGGGCLPGEEVVVTWDDGTVLGTFTADDNGDFVTTVTVPMDATLGVHLLTATCGDLEQFLNVNVLAETLDNVDDGTLARTGSNSTTPLIGIGAAALVLGGAFLYGARRPTRA